MVIQSRGHRLAEFDVWERVLQAIHPEIHSRRERKKEEIEERIENKEGRNRGSQILEHVIHIDK